MSDDVVNLDSRRASRRRRTPAPITPRAVTALPFRTISAPEEAVLHLLVRARLRARTTSDDTDRARLAEDTECYALAVGAVLHPRNPKAARAVRTRIMVAIRHGTTDAASLLRIARSEDSPPDAG